MTSHLFIRQVRIPSGRVFLEGELVVPELSHGVVLFVHGSGSSRHSTRNKYVARVLQDGGIATLLFDLFTQEEEAIDRYTGHLRFDIRLLTDRLADATTWISNHEKTCTSKIGYFGASTGGGAALVTAASLGEAIGAVVSRGGRPDLAMGALHLVKSPTLLIVGELDDVVIRLNQQAYAQLTCKKEFCIVPNATHLFEEPGALEAVADLAKRWFLLYL